MQWKLKHWEESIKKQFARCVAPGQADKFIEALDAVHEKNIIEENVSSR